MAKKKPTPRKSRRKPAAELDDAHAFQRLFPKEVRDEVKRVAKDADDQAKKREGSE